MDPNNTTAAPSGVEEKKRDGILHDIKKGVKGAEAITRSNAKYIKTAEALRAQAQARAVVEHANAKAAQALNNQEHGQELLAEVGAKLQREAVAVPDSKLFPLIVVDERVKAGILHDIKEGVMDLFGYGSDKHKHTEACISATCNSYTTEVSDHKRNARLLYEQVEAALKHNEKKFIEAKQFAPDILKRQEKLREMLMTLSNCTESRAKKLIYAEEFNKNNLLLKINPDNHDIFDLSKRTTMNQDVDAVGIDLGTSRCCVAVNRKNGIHTVALENTGERLLPSYVAYDEENIKCGQIVIDRLRYFSEATVFDSKRIIGKCIVNADKIWPFKIVNINNQPTIILKTERGEIRQSPTEVAAVLLKYMKTKAEGFQGKKLSKVVITVPAAFTEAQQAATKEAAILAGWETVKLLPEPIAASFAYFFDRPIPNNSILLLFDLGGGTLDVCVFKIINDKIQIISKNGDSKLGGRDFDNILMDYFSNKLNLDYDISKLGINMLNLNNDNSANKLIYEDEISKLKNKKFKLLMECQKIKHNLSVRNEDQLDSNDIDPALNGFIKITQKNFKDLSEDLLNRIQNTIFSALYKSGFKADQINKVLQVGGGCRMPMIKELLQELFPSAEQCCEEHPDEVVAIGAAHYAYNIFSN
uniref:Heat shock protein 70 n=1 Tax=Panagrolaimus davidi TaxID=227884 RepID=A0A914PEJ7_9BILA